MTPESSSDTQDSEGQFGIEVRIAVRNAADASFIEKATGPAFYTHLRGAERIVEFRLRALGRAHEQYEQARVNDSPEPEVAGFGLLVLQRVFLIVEDLGGLMYAVTGPDPWKRLTSYYAPELDEVFLAVLERRIDLLELLAVPTDEELEASPKLEEHGRAVARKLRDITLKEVRPLFDFAASFWMSHREAAKTTMHGFGVVAAEHLIAPPGGGELSELVPMEAGRPFALALVSREDQAALQVETKHHPLDLTPANVEMVRNTGIAAGELYLLLARAHRGALRLGHPWTLTNAYADRLSAEERETLAEAAAT